MTRLLHALLMLACLAAWHGGATATAAPQKEIRIGVIASFSDSQSRQQPGPGGALPLVEAAETLLAGARNAAEIWKGRDLLEGRTLTVVPIDDRNDPKGVRKLATEIKKARLHGLIAAPTATLLDGIVTLARKQKAPVILLGPWEPRFAVDEKDPILFFSASAVDHAIAAARQCLIPLKAVRAAALHDGSRPSVALAEAFLRNLPPRVEHGGAHAVPDSADAMRALATTLAAEKNDVLFVATAAGRARLVATAVRKGPRLLFADGLLTPGLVRAAPQTARFLAGAHVYSDQGSLVRYRKARDEAGLAPSPLGERAFAAATLILKGRILADENRIPLTTGLRRLRDFTAEDATVFNEWGQVRVFDHFLWQGKEGAPERLNPLMLPSLAGGELLRFRPSSHFRLDPESQMVLLSFGKPDESTIDEDLKALHLTSKGYQADMDAWVKDEILARAMSRLHRLYRRNADGTPIQGVSWNVTFGTELPDNAKMGRVWYVTIAGDDPAAGGRAFGGSRAEVYSTFIRRTMYEQHALEPGLHRPDYPYFTYKYEWGSSLAENLRHDTIRALIDGFAGAIAMTTAHECGHLAGCGHDTESPRSIMNVLEGAGLEPSWAEWIPMHARAVEVRLGRVAAPRR